MAVRIVGPITTNIDAILDQRQYDVVFGAIEFSKSVQYTSLQGPFSLAVDINNTSGFDLFIGVSIQTREQNIIIADRRHIIFCPHNDHITLSSSSVPALAAIYGEVIKITVSLYRNNTPTTAAPHNVLTTLFLDDPISTTSAQERIGTDRITYNISEFLGSGPSGDITLQQNTLNQQVLFHAPVLIYRSRIRSVTLALAPTPFPGDTRLRAFIGNSGAADFGELASIYSLTDQWSTFSQVFDVEIRNNQYFYIYGDNVNTTNDYIARASFTVELIY